MTTTTYYTPPKAFDSAAAAFFAAANITDTVQRNAVNALVRGMKAAGIWTKMLAVYPAVGGNAVAHAVNLKQPGTFNLSFQGIIYHDANGMLGQGGGGFTGIRPLTHLPVDSLHLAFYSRNTSGGYGQGHQIFIGCADDDYNHGCYFYARQFSDGWSFRANSSTENNGVTLNRPEYGMTVMSRTNAATARMFNRGDLIVDYTNVNYVTGATNAVLSVFGINHYTSFTNVSYHQCAFGSIGTGLTDAEVAQFTVLVDQYQQALGRAV